MIRFKDYNDNYDKIKFCDYGVVGSVVEWLKRRDHDRHGIDLKFTCTILFGPWERHFKALFFYA